METEAEHLSLRAAAAQAVIAHAIHGHLRRNGVTLKKVCEATGRNAHTMSKKLSGELTMTMEDIAWAVGIGVSWTSEELVAAGREAVASARRGLQPPSQLPKLPPTLSFEIAVPQRPQRFTTPAVGRLVRLAGPTVARSMRALSEQRWSTRFGDDAEGSLVVKKAAGDARVCGGVYPDHLSAEICLPLSWVDDVERSGMACVGDYVVAQVLSCRGDRPHEVVALRAVPDFYVMDYDPDAWEWALSPAAVGSDGSLRWVEPRDDEAARVWARVCGLDPDPASWRDDR